MMPMCTAPAPQIARVIHSAFMAPRSPRTSDISVYTEHIDQKNLTRFLPHLRAHAQQLPDRSGGQTLHLIVQLGDRLEKAGHGLEALARVIGPGFFGIQFSQAAAEHLARRIDLPS